MTSTLALYNPAFLAPQVLLAEFTARRPLLDVLLDIIRSNKDGQPPQHCLLLGRRGMGKTTTLWAVAHSVGRDAELSHQWQPVVFDEESRRVGDLADFWLEAIRQWEHATNDGTNRSDRLLDLAQSDIEALAQRTFLELVEGSGKKALLLIDNLNNVLSSIRDAEALHRLRAFLMREYRVVVIGAATEYFAEITSIDRPFYEFFRCFELPPLSLEEMRECLVSLADSRGDQSVRQTLEQRQGTVQALHLLTGGNPRLIKTFYRLLRDGLRTDIRADLEKLLDEFTPYFKAVFDALPVQQQRILDAVALAWDPVEVARIATATRLPSNQVSAQLRALLRLGLISEASGSPKRKKYLLTDRFSNIHYLMRHGRAARNRFDWFVALVALLFPDKEATDVLAQVALDASECGPDGQMDAHAVLQSALSRMGSPDARRDLINATLRARWSRDTVEALGHWFDKERLRPDLPEIDLLAFCSQMPHDLRRKLGYEPTNAEWWDGLISFLEERHEWALAEHGYRKAIELDARSSERWHRLGHLLEGSLGRPNDAAAAYRQALAIETSDVSLWLHLATMLSTSQGGPDEAQAVLREAIKLNPTEAVLQRALGDLLFNRSKRYQEAEEVYRAALSLDPKDPHAQHGLGDLLRIRGEYVEAETHYRAAIALDPMHVFSWCGLGEALSQLGRIDEAEVAYREALRLAPDAGPPNHLFGHALHAQRKFAEAEEAFRRATQAEPSDGCAWNGLGDALRVQRREGEAEAAYLQGSTVAPTHALSWHNLGHLWDDQGKMDEAEAGYRKAIALEPTTHCPWLQLARLLRKKPGAETEARATAAMALKLAPSDVSSQKIFRELCRDYDDDWRTVLPSLIDWSVRSPRDKGVFTFAVEGLLSLARLSDPSAALAFLAAQPNSTPFETLADAFAAYSSPSALSSLAPERRAVALELLRRLREPHVTGSGRKPWGTGRRTRAAGVK